MVKSAARWFATLPTAAKLLLILTALLLPIGVALSLIASSGIRDANGVLRQRSANDARAAARAVESLIARNALALRVAAAGALSDGSADPCGQALKSLATAPAVSRSFTLRDGDGKLLCTAGGFSPRSSDPLVAPGDIRVWIDPDGGQVDLRVGVVGGMATASVTADELRRAAAEATDSVRSLDLLEADRHLEIIDAPSDGELDHSAFPIANGALTARVGFPVTRITTTDQVVLMLPLLMWVLAALVTWLLVTRLLIRPLNRLQRAVLQYQPGQDGLDLPRNVGPSTEIQELRDAFGRAVTQVEESEREMTDALAGQRRLVREVHHRVKNNLQVVASLLNIHGRSAGTLDARAAYGAIGRRVGALSIVHRNHFAEMEENRGIALRPLLSELAAELRAGAPEPARKLAIDLELETVNTTQDVAVAVSFLVTEIVEYAMLNRPQDPVEVSLRRTSELTARLTLSSPVLVPDDSGTQGKAQFERIVTGLARQLRSTLERKLGRYSVDLPIFPPLG
ncbi:MAG TPA: sensor histidine kinase [Sphingomicrobium sp.]